MQHQATAVAAASAAAKIAAMAAKAEAALQTEVDALRSECERREEEASGLRVQLSVAHEESGAMLRVERELSLKYREELDALRIELGAAQGTALAAASEAAGLRKEAATRAEEQRAAAIRAEEQAALVGRIERQLVEQMQRSVAAQQALAAAEEIQRRLDLAAAQAGGGGPLTIVLMPED